MVEIWYTILAFTITVYLVLDGRNFGAGALQAIVAKTLLERRQVIAAIGPLWSWHEVWIVATGGVLFVAFPRFLAVAFPGYYLALFLVLWSLILRGMSLEVGGHIDNPLWQQFWDSIFSLSSIALAALFGVALGNLVRGVPIDASGEFQMAFFTNFRTIGHVGLLDWYTISMGVFVLLLLCAHGATYLMVKTEGPVHDRSEKAARQLWAIVCIGLIVITIETWRVRPALFAAMPHHPLALLTIVAVLVAGIAIFTGFRRGMETLTFFGSWLFIGGFLGAGAASMFPMMLYSTLGAEYSLTAYNSSASHKSLCVAIVWWPIAFALACVYFVFILRKYLGKVKPLQDTQGFY
jgi:cytochrome bd ubiquinol oxidase subunit II